MRFLTENLEQIDSPREWVQYLIDLETPIDEMAQVSAEINGVPIPVVARKLPEGISLTATWPRSGPGHYEITLKSDSSQRLTSVTIESQKLGADRWRQMVHDLQDRLTASIAIGLQQMGGLQGLEILRPGAALLPAEIRRLQIALYGLDGLPGLKKIIPKIVADPHSDLATENLQVPVQRARRIQPHLLHRALSTIGEDQLPDRVIDRRSVVNLNTYENRVVKLFLVSASARLDRLIRQRASRRFRDTQLDALLSTMQSDMRRLHAQSAAFRNSVADVDRVPTNVTMVILKRPEYRAAMDGYLRLHRQLAVKMDGPNLEVVLDNTPSLYQTWGAMMVIDRLIHLAPEAGWSLHQQNLIVREADGLTLRLPRGRESALILIHPDTSERIEVWLEPSFTPNTRIRSTSFEQRPDVVVAITHADKSVTAIVLDPKYKLDSEDGSFENASPVKVDIDKMHAYRDAIVGPDGARMVTFAGILYPGRDVRFGSHIAAIQCLPGESTMRSSILDEILESALSGASFATLNEC